MRWVLGILFLAVMFLSGSLLVPRYLAAEALKKRHLALMVQASLRTNGTETRQPPHAKSPFSLELFSRWLENDHLSIDQLNVTPLPQGGSSTTLVSRGKDSDVLKFLEELGSRGELWSQLKLTLTTTEDATTLFSLIGELNPNALTEEVSTPSTSPVAHPHRASLPAERLTKIFTVQFANTAEILQVITQSGWLTTSAKVAADTSLNRILVQGTESDMRQVEGLLATLDTPPPQVLIEARILEVDEEALNAFGVVINNLGFTGSGIKTEAATSIGLKDPSGILHLSTGELTQNFSMDIALQALETRGLARVLSAPKLMVLDGQTALIEQGTEVPYATESDNGSSHVQFKKAVMGLSVTPRVIDGREISLNLLINKDSVSPTTLASAENEPLINTQQIKTFVRVINGETILLGGIIETHETHSHRSVPIVGDIPLIGSLFRSKSSGTERKEIIILLRPIIMSRGSPA
jgi:type IV pilus assembly protein PilQ